MLNEEIKMHQDYQQKLEELTENNDDLKTSEGKYKKSIQ